MKLDALDHPKTYALVSVLGISRPAVIGHLELLWAFTGKNAPQGNIGKWPNGAIARACDWDGNPDLFVQALIGAGLLDNHEDHRIIVHDWHQHAPGWVRAKLKGLHQSFVTPKPTEIEGSPPGSTPWSPPGTGPSIQGKCSEAKGSEALPPAGESFDVLTAVKTVYPRGLHRGDHWLLAEREIGKLLDQGETPETLVQAATDYAAQMSALGKVGTETVMRPNNFFNGSGAWRGPFPLPEAQKPTSRSLADRLTWRPDPEEELRAAEKH